MRRAICAGTGLVLAVLSAIAVLPARDARGEDDLAPKLRGALLKVHVTTQGWDWRTPWSKANPATFWQRGVVVRPGLVLTPAARLADHTLIEVSEANSGRRYPAALERIDYGCNLALVTIGDAALAGRTKPLPLGESVTIDDEFEVWQLGASDLLERATGRVQKVAVQGVRLELTIKTTLSDGGNGQVALREGRVVGLVTSTRSNRQEGTVLALETIHHFLADHDSGEYRGFGARGFWTQKLLRDDLRAYYEVPEGVHGVGVSLVAPGRTGDGVIEKGDVITALAGHDLDDEGMFEHPRHGRLHMSWLLLGETHPGDAVPAVIHRGGEARKVDIPIRSWPAAEQLVPPRLRDARPLFIVVGGLIVEELNAGSRGVGALLGQYQRRGNWNPQTDRNRITWASRVLVDVANKGLEKIRGVVILEVNGMKIDRIQDVAEALKRPLDGYHVFTFEGVVKNFVVKADELAAINERIAERYGIPELQYLGED